jgi:transcription elongation factor GreA
MAGQSIPMSQTTFTKLSKKLDKLKKVDRPAIIAEIAQARTQGDLNENAEYHAAKERQGQIEASIQMTEEKLARAEVITRSASQSKHIIFGATVVVKNLETQEEMQYTLVGPDGVHIDENKISHKSPIGKGLMGKKAGDVAEIKTPNGMLKLQVVKFF